MSESYGAFAYAYDRALGERFFKGMVGLLDEAIRNHCVGGRTHLDAACGSGLALAHLIASGWRSVGVDLSWPMLQIAGTRVRAGRLVLGDLRRLPMLGTFSLVTCLYDSLNHMMERSDLVAAFRSIAGVMDETSRFVFDMNQPQIYPAVWGLSEPFYANGRGWELEIGTTWHPRRRLGRATVRGFATIGGKRVEISEQHSQRAYPEKHITSALWEAGLEPADLFDFDPFGEGGPAVKFFYVCRRRR